MSEAFKKALRYLVDIDEGDEFTDDPRDSGGPSKFGVTIWAYSTFLGRAVSQEEIQALTFQKAGVFYEARYWKPLRCESLQSGAAATAIFDSGVLYGIGTAAIITQKALNSCGADLKTDGVLGDKSIAALNATPEEDFLEAFHALLLKRIDTVIMLNPKNESFRKGWTQRADRLLTLSSAIPLNREVT